jgi:hypothetical protein
MDTRSLWDRYKTWLYDDPATGFRLDVSRIDLRDDHAEAMAPAFAKAFSAMEALESGAIANPDENRMVGHYWLRAPERAPSPEITGVIRETLTRILAFADGVHHGRIRPDAGERFTDVLTIGIGGSALGPQFVADALGAGADRLVPHFLDNTDPDGMDRVFHRLGSRLATTLTIVISKSGGTPETSNGMLEAAAAYDARAAASASRRRGHAGGEPARPYAVENRVPRPVPDVGSGSAGAPRSSRGRALPAAVQGSTSRRDRGRRRDGRLDPRSGRARNPRRCSRWPGTPRARGAARRTW